MSVEAHASRDSESAPTKILHLLNDRAAGSSTGTRRVLATDGATSYYY